MSCCPVLFVLYRLPIRPTCPVRPVPAVRSQMSCPDPRLVCPDSRLVFPVPAILFKLACPGHLVQFSTDATVMSWQSCHLCPFQAHLSKADLLDQPVETVLFEWSCPGFLSQTPQLFFPGCPVLAVLSLLTCSGRPFYLCFLSWPYYLICLLWLSCPCYVVPAFHFWLSCPGCPVLAVLSRQSCPYCPVQAVLY